MSRVGIGQVLEGLGDSLRLAVAERAVQQQGINSR